MRAFLDSQLAPVFGAATGISRVDFYFGLTDSEGEGRCAVLAVPVVAKVDRELAGPEEVVRRCERCYRSAFGLHGHDAVCGLKDCPRGVDGAFEFVVLPDVCCIAPGYFGIGRDDETLEAGVVLVGDGGEMGLGDDLLLD